MYNEKDALLWPPTKFGKLVQLLLVMEHEQGKHKKRAEGSSQYDSVHRRMTYINALQMPLMIDQVTSLRERGVSACRRHSQWLPRSLNSWLTCQLFPLLHCAIQCTKGACVFYKCSNQFVQPQFRDQQRIQPVSIHTKDVLSVTCTVCTHVLYLDIVFCSYHMHVLHPYLQPRSRPGLQITWQALTFEKEQPYAEGTEKLRPSLEAVPGLQVHIAQKRGSKKTPEISVTS